MLIGLHTDMIFQDIALNAAPSAADVAPLPIGSSGNSGEVTVFAIAYSKA